MLHHFTDGRFDPPIPVDQFGSLHVWAESLQQWVKPSFIGATGELWYATEPKQAKRVKPRKLDYRGET